MAHYYYFCFEQSIIFPRDYREFKKDFCICANGCLLSSFIALCRSEFSSAAVFLSPEEILLNILKCRPVCL